MNKLRDFTICVIKSLLKSFWKYESDASRATNAHGYGKQLDERKSPVEMKTNQMHCECYENSTDCISLLTWMKMEYS